MSETVEFNNVVRLADGTIGRVSFVLPDGRLLLRDLSALHGAALVADPSTVVRCVSGALDAPSCPHGHPWTRATTRYCHNHGYPQRYCGACEGEQRTRRKGD